MSFDTERYNLEKLSGQSLAVIQCGMNVCHSGHTTGNLVYREYSVHFVLDGRGTYVSCGKKYELEKGNGFIIKPGVPNICTADTEEPWKYIYVVFKGADAQSLVNSCGLDEDNLSFDFPLDEATLDYFEKMHSACRNNGAKGYDALGYFLLIMSNLVAKYNKRNITRFSSEHYIRLALSYMNDHLSYNITVRDIAKYVGIDRTHLYRIFMNELGKSPSKCLTEERLKLAVGLMEHKELSVNEVAVSAGFYDISHFTKAFAAKYGVSPGKYRDMYIIN